MKLKSKKRVNVIITINIEHAWIWLNKWDCQYASGPKYAKILLMAGFSLCQHYTVFWIWQGSEYGRVPQGSKYTTI